MRHTLLRHPLLVLAVAFFFMVFTVGGCSSAGTAQTTSNDNVQIPNAKHFSFPIQKVNSGIEKVLYDNGYLIVSRDHQLQTMTAEKYTSLPLEEETPITPERKNSAADVFITILGIIFIVGIIVLIIDAFSSPNSSPSTGESQSRDDVPSHYSYPEDAKTHSYKYVMHVKSSAENDTVTRVEMNVTKVTNIDGTPVSSIPVKISNWTKIFFESLERELYFVQQ